MTLQKVGHLFRQVPDRRSAFYFVLMVIFLYVLFIGFPASAIRAALMGSVLLLAQKLGRLRSADRALLFVATLMLIINPSLLLFDVGFQLSFSATLGIIYLKPIIDKKTEKLINIGQAVAYIENNFRKPLQLKELAEKASLSPRHFSRIFKNNYNTSPIEYIIQLRIKHACKLLQTTQMNITKIAMDCGFSDSNYFTRQFKKMKGITPSQYRDKNK